MSPHLPPSKGDRVRVLLPAPRVGPQPGVVVGLSPLTGMVWVQHDDGDLRWWPASDLRPEGDT